MTYNVLMFVRGTNSLKYEMPVYAFSSDEALEKANKLSRRRGEFGIIAAAAYPAK